MVQMTLDLDFAQSEMLKFAYFVVGWNSMVKTKIFENQERNVYAHHKKNSFFRVSFNFVVEHFFSLNYMEVS